MLQESQKLYLFQQKNSKKKFDNFDFKRIRGLNTKLFLTGTLALC